MSLFARYVCIADCIEIRWTSMTVSSRSSVYVNGRIDFLLAINVRCKIIGKR